MGNDVNLTVSARGSTDVSCTAWTVDGLHAAHRGSATRRLCEILGAIGRGFHISPDDTRFLMVAPIPSEGTSRPSIRVVPLGRRAQGSGACQVIPCFQRGSCRGLLPSPTSTKRYRFLTATSGPASTVANASVATSEESS